MTHRVLFADDQLPSSIEAENEQSRRELRREFADKPNIDSAIDKDFAWFNDLLDYLETTKNLKVIRVRSYLEAQNRLERPEEFDVAIIDLSWTGDASLPPGRQHRHNVGLKLIQRIFERRHSGGPFTPTIAFSQNFKDDFELMATVLEMDALPIPKSYDRLGHRALYSAIRYLARVHPAAGNVKLFVSHAHDDVDIAAELVTAIELAMDAPDGAIRCTAVPGYKLDFGSMAADVLRQELGSAQCVVAILTPQSLASHWVMFELGATWWQAKRVVPLLGGGVKERDIPGPLRGIAGGRLEDASTFDQLLDQVMGTLGWTAKNRTAALARLHKLAASIATRQAAKGG